jgi:hypothetical protein
MFTSSSTARELLSVVGGLHLFDHDNPLARITALELLLRVAQILAVDKLTAARERYSVTQQALMGEPEAPFAAERDALVDEADFLGCRDLLDLLSDIESPCIAPRLHRGWQDRVQSCQQARRISHEIVGFSLSSEERQPLLAALGICNRVFRAPPPLDLGDVNLESTLAPVVRLIERLAPEGESEAIRELTAKIVAGR